MGISGCFPVSGSLVTPNSHSFTGHLPLKFKNLFPLLQPKAQGRVLTRATGYKEPPKLKKGFRAQSELKFHPLLCKTSLLSPKGKRALPASVPHQLSLLQPHILWLMTLLTAKPTQTQGCAHPLPAAWSLLQRHGWHPRKTLSRLVFSHVSEGWQQSRAWLQGRLLHHLPTVCTSASFHTAPRFWGAEGKNRGCGEEQRAGAELHVWG